MNYPSVKFIFDRRHKSSSQKAGTIEMIVSDGTRRKIRSTGIAVLPSEWNDVDMVINRPDALVHNRALRAARKEVEDLIDTFLKRGEPFTVEALEDSRRDKEYNGSFLEFVECTIKARNDIRESTRHSHLRVIGTLKRYGRMLRFSELKKGCVEEFDNWLHGQYSEQSTVYTYHKILRLYVAQAHRRGFIKLDPYEGFRSDKGIKDDRRFLTDEELERVANIECSDMAAMRARDVFLFQCYTGLAYADLALFDFSKVQNKNGRLVVHASRQKTGVKFHVVLLSPAIEILERYDYRLPLLTNQKYNQILKTVAARAGLDFPLTSHCGRHTYATWCLNRGVPIETLKGMLGHSSSRSTAIYAKLLNRTVEDAFEMLENKIQLQKATVEN